MSKKKNSKKNKIYDKIRNTENFLNECFKYNQMVSEQEKEKKCIELLHEIPNLGKPRKDKELFFYSMLGQIYYDASKIESQEYKFSDGMLFDINTILEESNKKYLEEVLNYKLLSFDNYKKFFNIITDNNYLNNFDINSDFYKAYNYNKTQIRIITQDLSGLYYFIGDEEKFLNYGKIAIEYHSLQIIGMTLKHYCDKLDYDNAYIYYKLLKDFDSKDYGTYGQNIIIKLYSYMHYFRYLYNLGLYEESLKITKEAKKYYIDFYEKIDMRETLKTINNIIDSHIEKCEEQISKAQKIKYSEEKLLNYFDKKIIDLMTDDNKIYILTSLNIYEYMKKSEITMDYSAVLMPILKSIENIIFEIVAKEYHSFILGKKEIDKWYIKGFLNKDNEIIMKIDRLEYGLALSLIGKKSSYKYDRDEIIPNKYFIEFCNKNNIKNSRDVVIKIYTELDNLRLKRNLVAHKNRVYEDSVKECYDILLDNIKFINY